MSQDDQIGCRRPLSRRDQLTIAAALAVWSAVGALGWCAMTAYAYRTADEPVAASSATWPADSRLPRETGRDTLLLFLHPKCPCSEATLSELERLLASSAGSAALSSQLQIVVVAATPASPAADWIATPLMERSQELPAAQVFVDRGGVETDRFGASTSGTIMLYDAGGLRTYRGGITVARGHEGLSTGGVALAKLLAGDRAPTTAIPAFGCRLISTPAGDAAVATTN